MKRNKYINNSISNKLLIANIIFVCIMLLIILLDYVFVHNREELNTRSINVLKQNDVYESLNSEIDRIKVLCVEFGDDLRVYSFGKLSVNNRNNFIADIKNKIDILTKSFPYNVDLYIKLNDAGYIIGKDGIIDENVFNKVIDQKNNYSHSLYGSIEEDTDIWNTENEDIKIFSEYILYNLEVNSKCRIIARIETNDLEKFVFGSEDDRFETVVLKGEEVFLSSVELDDKEKQQILKINEEDKQKKYKINNSSFYASVSEINIYGMRVVNFVSVHNQRWTYMIAWQYLTILLLFLLVNILFCVSNLKIYRPIKNIFDKYNEIGQEAELIDRLLTQVNENVIQKQGEENKLRQILQRNNFYNLCYNDGKDVDWNSMRELTDGFDCMVMLYIVFEDDYGEKQYQASEKFYEMLSEEYRILEINRTFDKGDVYIVSIEQYEVFLSSLEIICCDIIDKNRNNVFITGGLSKTFEDICRAAEAFKQCEYAIRNQPVKMMDGKTISEFNEDIIVKKDKKSVVDVMSQTNLIKALKEKDYDGIHKYFDNYLERIKEMSFEEGREMCKYLERFLRYAISGEEIDKDAEAINIDSVYNIYAIFGLIRHKFLLMSQNHSEKRESLCNSIIEFVNNHFDEELSLDIIADRFNITSSYLSSYFKKNTEMNISQYIMIIRLKKAADMLVNNKKMKISEISEKVGIPNINTFNRLFKKYYDETPSRYRMNADSRDR